MIKNFSESNSASSAAVSAKKSGLSAAIKTKALNEYALFFALIAFAGALAFGKGYSYAVTDGVKLWAASVLPALLPYFFITALLSELSVTAKLSDKLSPPVRKLFNLNGNAGFAFVMSALSGYPVGAKLVADLKTNGCLSDAESVRAAAICSLPSPMFIIAGVGGIMFNDKTFGACVLACNVLAALFTGVIFSFYKNTRNKAAARRTDHCRRPESDGGNPLYDGIYSAVISVLVVGGLIAVFTVIAEILNDAGALKPVKSLIGVFTDDENVKNGISAGLLEMTGGLKALSSGGKTFLSLPSAAAISGFGGACVLVQSAAYLKSARIKTAPFLAAKALEAVLSFCFGLLFSLAFFK